MKRVISLLLAVLLLATFAVGAMAESVNSPVKPGSGAEVIPGNAGTPDHPNPGIVQVAGGELVLQNSKGEQEGLHVVLDVNGDQSFITGGYDLQPGQHIDEIPDPVIKITFVNSAIKANKDAQPGDATDTNVGYETNQMQIDLYNKYMDNLSKGGSIDDFVDSLGDEEAAEFNALLKKLGKEKEKFVVADFFEVTINKAAKDFLKGEKDVPITFILTENFDKAVGDNVIIGNLLNPNSPNQKLGYLVSRVVSNSQGKTGMEFTINLMNTGVFMVFSERKASDSSNPDADDPAVGGGTITGVVSGSATSPKTGDLGETAAEHSFPWALVSVLCLAAAFGVSRMGKKEN